ncbi:MAG: MotA/TolQ/ExbB proton channel family protein [Blautia sp.]|nr:MotA/TolQ/ExbB proton channel family protein [Blautia sp.]
MGKKLINMLLFLLVAAGCILMTLYVGRDNREVMLYNFVFMGIMIVVYFAGLFGGMFRMDDLGRALHRCSQEIISIFKIPGKARTEDLAVLEGSFENRFLDKKLREFTEDVGKTQEGIGDVEDYINSDELDIFVHKRLLEMVPDIFTSLGILGTFIGLVWGLKNFQPNNYEAMTTSVSALVDGIKVAFLTSIYGIAFSIIYSCGMKSAYSDMSERLQVFLNRFHSFVMPSAENESRNLLVASQKIQTDAMNNMAERFSGQMADSFEKVITPTFQKMNSSLDMLVTSVTKVQTEAIQEILNVFISEMRSSFDMQFQDFNEALAKLTKAEEECTRYTKELYQSLSQELASSFTQQEDAMRESVTQMGNLQSRFMSTAAQITKENQAIQKQQQQDYQHVAQYMKDAEQSAAKFWVACNQTMKRYVETCAETMEGVSKAGNQSVELLADYRRMVEQFDASMKDYAEYQKKSYQTMEQVNRLLTDISAVGTGNAAITNGRNVTMKQQENMSRMLQLMEAQNSNTQSLLEELQRDMRELQKTSQKGGKFTLFNK